MSRRRRVGTRHLRPGDVVDDVEVVDVTPGKDGVVLRCMVCGRTRAVTRRQLRAGTGTVHAQACAEGLTCSRHFRNIWLRVGRQGTRGEAFTNLVDFHDRMHAGYLAAVARAGGDEGAVRLLRLDTTLPCGPANCRWGTSADVEAARPRTTFTAWAPDGRRLEGTSVRSFARAHGLGEETIRRALAGDGCTRAGWRFAPVGAPEPQLADERWADERWAVVDECPDYEVSDQGRVRRADNHRPVSTGGRSRGYPLAGLTRPDGVRVGRTVHRLVARAFVPGYAPGLQVNHLNGVKTDNRAVNLEWVTPEENVAHARRLGLFKAGAACAQARAVVDVDTGERWPTVTACARALGVCQAAVSQACASWTGKTRRAGGRRLMYADGA